MNLTSARTYLEKLKNYTIKSVATPIWHKIRNKANAYFLVNHLLSEAKLTPKSCFYIMRTLFDSARQSHLDLELYYPPVAISDNWSNDVASEKLLGHTLSDIWSYMAYFGLTQKSLQFKNYNYMNSMQTRLRNIQHAINQQKNPNCKAVNL